VLRICREESGGEAIYDFEKVIASEKADEHGHAAAAML